MAGLDRYTDILGLFRAGRPVWSVQEIADELALPSSTIYRTVRELSAGQFLARASEAKYRLGTAFVQYDRVLRLTDPVSLHGAKALGGLVANADIACVGLVASLYGDQVMCVADAVLRDPPFRSSYERGRPMPLTRGATSKAILAHLPRRHLSKLLAEENDETGGQALRAALIGIRRQGYAVSKGEIDSGLVGIAAPAATPDGGIVASLSLVIAEQDLAEHVERRLVLLVVSAASLLQQALVAA